MMVDIEIYLGDMNPFDRGILHQYQQGPSLAKCVLQYHEGIGGVQTRKNTITRKDHPFDPE